MLGLILFVVSIAAVFGCAYAFHGYVAGKVAEAELRIHGVYARAVNGIDVDAQTLKLRILDIYHKALP